MGRTRIIVVLAIAAIGAIGLALIVGALTRHKNAPAPVVIASSAPALPVAKVLVAKHDLPIGARLGPDDLAWQDWPANAVNPAFITDGQGARIAPTHPVSAVFADQAKQTVKAAVQVVSGAAGPMQQLYGSIVREPILANEPIINTKLVRGGEGGYMAVVLRPGMRAVAVQVNATTAAGGFILPGDHVDVLQSHATGSGGDPSGYAAQTLLRNIRVLAIDQNSQPPKSGTQTQVGATATLEVSAADTEIVASAKRQGEVILALRAYSDANGPSGRGVDSQSVDLVRIFRSGQAPEVVVLQ
ncbi:MAG TPA: Flp pilus assembly protein CpaB [Caulobacteraceae bacterium]|jgi:pilus assembly protein CpaB|nr:Flp pilus assembly protein CpaB [Caulobacteraceae bacterium]